MLFEGVRCSEKTGHHRNRARLLIQRTSATFRNSDESEFRVYLGCRCGPLHRRSCQISGYSREPLRWLGLEATTDLAISSLDAGSTHWIGVINESSASEKPKLGPVSPSARSNRRAAPSPSPNERGLSADFRVHRPRRDRPAPRGFERSGAGGIRWPATTAGSRCETSDPFKANRE